ncbi:hypothetical protein [uncultured Pontibacter sp.]|uniref:hypothetical protein n=1 Tax=uncultured Pontibacter sp. TaxID=453356 RepID=UPI0026280C1B|nr:hypothetical protein [uncultured Pontibacter sp.]
MLPHAFSPYFRLTGALDWVGKFQVIAAAVKSKYKFGFVVGVARPLPAWAHTLNQAIHLTSS